MYGAGIVDALLHDMRTITIAIISIIVLAATSARNALADDGDEAMTLTAAEVGRYMLPYYPEVRGCILQVTDGGRIDLNLTIHRDGSVFQLAIATRGVSQRSARRLDRCLRRLASTWHFPVRRGFTNAVVPYDLVRVRGPGLGPQYSCWDPRGCTKRRRPPRT
jgi:hypothetical protein